MKDALWGGGGYHRSWPGGRGGRPRALVAGRRGDGSSKEGDGWLFQRGASPGKGSGKGWLGGQGGCKGFGCGGVGGRDTRPTHGANFATGGQGGGARARGGCKGFGSGGVGGRGTGPRDGANFATCVVFLSFLTGG